MKLLVQYMAQLRPAVGQLEEQVDLPEGSRLADLLRHLAVNHPEARPHLLDATGQMRLSLLAVLNGAAAPAGEASAMVLHAGDVVTLLPPIAGG